MAKSNDSFKKDEKEKLKRKKQQEKEAKKEERKANAKKSFEDMIVYVDEDGNLTSTPPDPKKKKVINQEDIQLGVPSRENDEKDAMRKGVVTFFNESKGFGFIKDKDTQESIFVHVNAVLEPIKENNLVTYEVEMTPKGASAVRVKKIQK